MSLEPSSSLETKASEPEALSAEVSSLSIEDGLEERTPLRRTKEPQHNQKRTDPFMFGSRYLNESDDIFEYNAWDHVETDDAFKEYAEQQFALQRQSPVSDFDKSEFNPSLMLYYYLTIIPFSPSTGEGLTAPVMIYIQA